MNQKFSKTWGPLIIALFLLSAVLQHAGLWLITLLLITATALAWLWNRYVLRQVEYTRQLAAGRAFAGERVALSVALANRKALPAPWLRVDDAFPDSLALFAPGVGGQVDQTLKPSSVPGRSFLGHLVTLGPFERVSWTYEIDCARRGFYFFGPARLQSGDILGFFQRQQSLETPGRLIVYPRVQSLPELGFPGAEPFGEKRLARHLVQDPLRTVGVREYHPEDSLRRVHWKASARHGELLVRVHEPAITQQLVIFLNVASFEHAWRGIIPERQEQAISVAASIAAHAVQRRFAVGLLANGNVPHSDQAIKVPPNRSPGQLTRVLESLAAVTGFATLSIENLLDAHGPRLALGATLVVVTTVVPESLLASILRLRDVGRRLVLVSMDPEFQDEAPLGISTFHLPLVEADFSGLWREGGENADERNGRIEVRNPWARGGRKSVHSSNPCSGGSE